jgi:hypothetical protein
MFLLCFHSCFSRAGGEGEISACWMDRLVVHDWDDGMNSTKAYRITELVMPSLLLLSPLCDFALSLTCP